MFFLLYLGWYFFLFNSFNSNNNNRNVNNNNRFILFREFLGVNCIDFFSEEMYVLVYVVYVNIFSDKYKIFVVVVILVM